MESKDLYRRGFNCHFYTSGIGLFREVLKAPSETNLPTEEIAAAIDKEFASLEKFKKSLRKWQQEDSGLDGLG